MTRTVNLCVMVFIASCVVRTAWAQEEFPQGQEFPMNPESEQLPPPSNTSSGPYTSGMPITIPAMSEPSCTAIRPLPVVGLKSVQTLKAKTEVVIVKRPVLKIKYRNEERIIHETVLKPCEVVREFPFTTMKACSVTDPITGKCSTVLKEFTEIRTRKETIYKPVVKSRVISVRVPYLSEETEEVAQLNHFIECHKGLEERTYVISTPSSVIRDRHHVSPCPNCNHDHSSLQPTYQNHHFKH